MHVDNNKADFCIGVAVSWKHLNLHLLSDLKRLKEKVDAGADYVDKFFWQCKYFEFC
jgi:methylenetetrahydrofolate reductase (NADPH)